MRLLNICVLLFISGALSAQNNNIDFDKFFINQTLRVDFYHSGDAKTEFISLDKIYKQGVWAGNPNQCIQPFELGSYKLLVMDTLTGQILYTKGYSTIFSEYQTTGPAIQGEKKTFHETALVPFPRKPIRLVIQKRAKDNSLADIYSLVIDPSDYHINTEKFIIEGNEVVNIINNGNPHHCVDLVILGEGYTLTEREKFKNDLKYFSNLLLGFEPYKTQKKLFNINGVFAPSEESGTDEPRQHIYRNTRFGSSFNTFDIDRYLTVEDNKAIHDAIANVPYDAILIMVNKDRYGGGGIFNFQTVFAIGSDKKDYVFLHEFGHGFAGLGDEYFTSQVAYQDIYIPGVEPLEANITALIDTANLKWKKFLSPGIKIPTDWGKEKFDSLNNAISSLQSLRAETTDQMKKAGKAKNEIDSKVNLIDKQIGELYKKADDFIFNHPLKDKVGVFEGANYLSKGYYRPTINSMMLRFSPDQQSYGPVNDQAIIKIIEYYTRK